MKNVVLLMLLFSGLFLMGQSYDLTWSEEMESDNGYRFIPINDNQFVLRQFHEKNNYKYSLYDSEFNLLKQNVIDVNKNERLPFFVSIEVVGDTIIESYFEKRDSLRLYGIKRIDLDLNKVGGNQVIRSIKRFHEDKILVSPNKKHVCLWTKYKEEKERWGYNLKVFDATMAQKKLDKDIFIKNYLPWMADMDVVLDDYGSVYMLMKLIKNKQDIVGEDEYFHKLVKVDVNGNRVERIIDYPEREWYEIGLEVHEDVLFVNSIVGNYHRRLKDKMDYIVVEELDTKDLTVISKVESILPDCYKDFGGHDINSTFRTSFKRENGGRVLVYEDVKSDYDYNFEGFSTTTNTYGCSAVLYLNKDNSLEKHIIVPKGQIGIGNPSIVSTLFNDDVCLLYVDHLKNLDRDIEKLKVISGEDIIKSWGLFLVRINKEGVVKREIVCQDKKLLKDIEVTDCKKLSDNKLLIHAEEKFGILEIK